MSPSILTPEQLAELGRDLSAVLAGTYSVDPSRVEVRISIQPALVLGPDAVRLRFEIALDGEAAPIEWAALLNELLSTSAHALGIDTVLTGVGVEPARAPV